MRVGRHLVRPLAPDDDDVLHSGGVFAVVSPLATWSPWLPFDAAALAAPREPGVYLARQNADELVYVGRAGERQGRGIHGRLSVYRYGKAAVSGLGEAALDRALADPAFVQQHLDELKAGVRKRATVWAQDALLWAGLEVSWAVTADRNAAAALERSVLDALGLAALWNRVR